MAGELTCIISNHEVLAKEAERYGLPFYHIPINKDNKAEAEAAQLKLVQEHVAELIVMARYMQVLSDDFLNKVGCPVINIHHSFLPAFAGGKPYHQAHLRESNSLAPRHTMPRLILTKVPSSTKT